MVQILIIDDDRELCHLLEDYFRPEDIVCRFSHDGRSALEDMRMQRPDMVILDVMLPEKNGFEVLRTLRRDQQLSTLPVIMLTARGGEYDQLQGFSQGADDYITKPFSTSLLLARIEAVLRRSGRGRMETLTAGGVSITPQQHRAEVDGREVELTPREFSLLHCFMSNPGIVLSRTRLLDLVWGFDFEGDERTVDTHVKNLRLKLGARADYIQTAYRLGYRFEVRP